MTKAELAVIAATFGITPEQFTEKAKGLADKMKDARELERANVAAEVERTKAVIKGIGEFWYGVNGDGRCVAHWILLDGTEGTGMYDITPGAALSRIKVLAQAFAHFTDGCPSDSRSVSGKVN